MACDTSPFWMPVGSVKIDQFWLSLLSRLGQSVQPHFPQFLIFLMSLQVSRGDVQMSINLCSSCAWHIGSRYIFDEYMNSILTVFHSMVTGSADLSILPFPISWELMLPLKIGINYSTLRGSPCVLLSGSCSSVWPRKASSLVICRPSTPAPVTRASFM